MMQSSMPCNNVYKYELLFLLYNLEIVFLLGIVRGGHLVVSPFTVNFEWNRDSSGGGGVGVLDVLRCAVLELGKQPLLDYVVKS